MSEQGHQTPAPRKRRRTTRVKAELKKSAAEQIPLVESASLLETPFQPVPDEIPPGERWREFPPQKSPVSEQLERPPINDFEAWRASWKAQGMLWRTEPEIDAERQKFLNEQRAIQPDIQKGVYPFKGVSLGRADVEWLLATHDGGQGPLKESAHLGLVGLDLRGADLRRADLRGLPLTRLRGGLTREEWHASSLQQLEEAAIHLEETDLRWVHLERANLRGAHIERAYLGDAFLEGADLFRSHFEGASLYRTHLGGRSLLPAPSSLGNQSEDPIGVLPPANLRRAFFDSATSLQETLLGDRLRECALVADVTWGGTNLTWLDWSQVDMLGDESRAKQKKTFAGQAKGKAKKIADYQKAIRANRQLSVVLKEQGLNEVADRFSYRAQLLQRVIFRLERRWLKYLFSWFLALLTGYGFRMWRIIIAYVLLILTFAGGYWELDRQAREPLNFGQALIVSITAFHGRVFSYNPFTLSDPQIVVTAIEAICGLVIEGLFVAMLVQRFFNR